MSSEARRGPGFAVTALGGLALAGTSAYLATLGWVEASASGETAAFVAAEDATGSQAAVVLSLALVVLACWGVVLVTGSRTRRVVLGLAAAAGAGALVAVPLAVGSAAQGLEDRYAAVGASVDTSVTAWPFAAGVALLLGVLLALHALRGVRRWPELGSQYERAPADPHDVWRALDRGEDPTGDATTDSEGR